MPAAAFNVTPMVVEIDDAVPGQNYIGQLTVSGSDAGTEAVRVYAIDWDRLPNGNYTSRAPGEILNSCTDWLSLNPTQFDTLANAPVIVKYSFTVPETAAGSYWSYIMVESNVRPDRPTGDSDNVQVAIGAKLRYAVRLVVNVNQGRVVSGEIGDMGIAAPPARPGETAKPKIKVLFRNTGNTYVKPTGYAEIRNLDGETVYQAEIKPFFVFPDRSLWVDAPIDAALGDAEYIVLAVMDYGGDRLVAGEIRFSVENGVPALDSGGDGNENEE